MSTCSKCEHDHARLGVQLQGATLTRRADKFRHMLTEIGAGGGAWSFDYGLIENHPELGELIIIERNTGEVWRVDRRTFDAHSFHLTLQGRPQTALALRWWNDTSAPHLQDEPDAAPVQLLLIESREIRGAHYERAKKPRPRVFRSKRSWDRAA